MYLRHKSRLFICSPGISEIHTLQQISIYGEKMNTPTLKTERLILRKFTEQDMKTLFLILKDEEVNKFLP